MKRLSAALLAIGLVSSSAAFAQSNYYPSGHGYNGYQQGEAHYDYAQVIRVDPVLDGRYSRTSAYSGQRCYETTTAGSYERDGYYRNDGYRNDGYRQDGYYDQYGRPQGGSTAGRNVATVVGGIAGAVLGSKVGGGSGTYAATAIGSMVGGRAGRRSTSRPSATVTCVRAWFASAIRNRCATAAMTATADTAATAAPATGTPVPTT